MNGTISIRPLPNIIELHFYYLIRMRQLPNIMDRSVSKVTMYDRNSKSRDMKKRQAVQAKDRKAMLKTRLKLISILAECFRVLLRREIFLLNLSRRRNRTVRKKTRKAMNQLDSCALKREQLINKYRQKFPPQIVIFFLGGGVV